MIVVIDYEMGNVGSIRNMIKKVGGQSVVTADVAEIGRAEKIILPGVGAFDAAMSNLERLGLVEVLRRRTREGAAMLGVCLGMQLLADGSEEGERPGLGLVPGRVVRFDHDSLRVPHMGWNYVEPAGACPLLAGVPAPMRFYFVHSYHYVSEAAEDVVGETLYGYRFASAVQRGNVFGMQFHPEKSHKYGMQLYRNFVAL